MDGSIKRRRLDRVKDHVRENKKTYISTSIAVVTTAVVTLIVVNAKNESVKLTIDSWKPVQYKSPHVSQNVVEVPARGHRGNVIYCPELKRFWSSQNEVSKDLKISPTTLSQHLNGGREHISNLTFERLGENLSEELSLSI